MKKVSIIVPVYNTENYLSTCLNSLLNQTLSDIEIICINDGSTDNSLEILEEYAKKDDRIKIINQENSGVSIARNIAIKVANGEFIGFVDSDDYIDSDFYEKLYNSAIKNNCDISAATIVRKRQYSQKYSVHYIDEKICNTLEEKIKACQIPDCCYIWNKLYRSELVNNSFFKEGVYFEDVLWLPEIIKNSNKLVTVSNANYYYRARKGSIVKTNSPKKQNDSYIAKKYIIEFFDNNNLLLLNKYRNITKKIKYLFSIPIFKIKEFEEYEIALLFGLIPIYKLSNKSDSRFCLKILFFKFSFRKNKFSSKEIKNLNFPYESGDAIVPNVYNSEKTLQELIYSNRSICRFGDGEFNLLLGEDLNFQKFNNNLQQRLLEILTNNSNIMIGIPNIFGNIDYHKAKSFWRKYLVYNRENIYSLLNMNKQYYDSLITRVYIDTDKTNEEYKAIFDMFKNLWNDRDIVIVEGKGSRFGVGNDLLDCAKSVKRVLCPVVDAYKNYDEILEICQKFSKNTLFILALGPTATVLAYDLDSLGYRALDLGHLDIEYEWFLQGATKKICIKNKYVNEAKNGRKFAGIHDSSYNAQIYKRVGICD